MSFSPFQINGMAVRAGVAARTSAGVPASEAERSRAEPVIE
jgi:hypothetical protein